MERVRGIGGIFFKARDKAALLAWYRDHLGIDIADWGGAIMRWRDDESPERPGTTTWSIFADDSDYFGTSDQQFMINYRVDDLDAMLAQLRQAGVKIDDRLEESEYGRFAWAHDPAGNRFELWEPPSESP